MMNKKPSQDDIRSAVVVQTQLAIFLCDMTKVQLEHILSIKSIFTIVLLIYELKNTDKIQIKP